jgi:hypothetical protein
LYSIDSSFTPPFSFSTTPSSPKLDVKGQLDFETTETYTFTVIVTDKGPGTPLTGTCDLTVIVTDVNEAPIIPIGQTLNVSETAPVGTEVGTSLIASDPDNSGRFASIVPKRQMISWSISTDDPNDPNKFQFQNQYIGMLSVIGQLDADMPSGQTSYTLRVSVSDGSLSTESDNIVITINEVNEPPTLTVPTGNEPTLVENSNGGSSMSSNTLVGTDPDSGDTLTYSIYNCDDGLNDENICLFKIDGNQIKINNNVGITSWNFNFEIKNSFNIIIRVTDQDGLYSQHAVPIKVTNTNDSPILEAGDTVTSVGIQPDVGLVVLQLTATDEDLRESSNNEQLTLSIKSGNDDDAWEILPPAVGGNLLGSQQAYWSIRVKSPLSNNLKISGHTWNLVITVTDQNGPSSDSENIQIVVQDGNARPYLITPAPSFSILESVSIDTVVSSISNMFTDGTQNDPITIFITSVSPTVNSALQPGQSRSNIGSGIGFHANATKELTSLNTQDLFDYERFKSFRLHITGKDWPLRNTPSRNFYSKRQDGIFDIDVVDVNEPPLFQSGLDSDGNEIVQQLNILENSVSGFHVGNVVAKDPDIDTVLTFSLATNPSHSIADMTPFSIQNGEHGSGTVATDSDNNVGRLTVSSTGTASLDYEASKNAFTFDIIASDNVVGASASTNAKTTVTVRLDDVNEPPTLSNAVTSVFENDPTWSYCLPFNDPDGPSGNTFVLVDPTNTLSSFADVRSPGCLYGKGNGFDYEDQETFVFTVKVTDDSIPSFNDTAILTVHVKNMMDITITSITPTRLPTLGGTIMINGTNIGPTNKKLDTISSDQDKKNLQKVLLTYTNPTSGLTVSYQALNCKIIKSSTAVSCIIPEGVGSEFTWTLRVGENDINSKLPSNNQTLKFSNDFKYSSPIITSVLINNINIKTNSIDSSLSTHGNTKIQIIGSSMGPSGVQTSAIQVKYARGLSIMDLRTNPSLGYIATNCSVTIAHTEITCKSVPGVGSEMEFWISNLAGGTSNVLNDYRARFQSPVLNSISVKTGSRDTINTLTTKGGTVVILNGEYFGPESTSIASFSTTESSSVSFGGDSGLGHVAIDCRVTIAQTTIECTTPSGTGTNHQWLVTRGDQTSIAVSNFKTSYAPPTVTSVSGQSLGSADTQGGLRITVLGSQFGSSVLNAVSKATNINIRYGSSLTPQDDWYSCTNVQLVTPSNAISCIMASGTGHGLTMIVTVDGQKSNALKNAISYAPPVVISFSGPGASSANTTGGEVVVIQGRNFGPSGSANIDSVRYGRSSDSAKDWLTGRACTVIESHFRIQCFTEAGGGSSLRWNVTISGQNSTSPTTFYDIPSIISITNGDSNSITTASTNGNEKIILKGTNFGPLGKRLIDEITFGPQGNQYKLKECSVTWLSREIVCSTPPGIGKDLRFIVNIAGQQSLLSSTAATLSFASPNIETTSDTTIDTNGQTIEFVGSNFGLKVS